MGALQGGSCRNKPYDANQGRAGAPGTREGQHGVWVRTESPRAMLEGPINSLVSATVSSLLGVSRNYNQTEITAHCEPSLRVVSAALWCRECIGCNPRLTVLSAEIDELQV